jgi:hypothetical protein
MRRFEARLYINDQAVGEVTVQRRGASWSHGQFVPGSAFEKFAPLFGRWARLIHDDGKYAALSEEVSEGLRHIEFDMDRLHAKVHLISTDEWVMCTQLNIDGSMIEWKTS